MPQSPADSHSFIATFCTLSLSLSRSVKVACSEYVKRYEFIELKDPSYDSFDWESPDAYFA